MVKSQLTAGRGKPRPSLALEKQNILNAVLPKAKLFLQLRQRLQQKHR